MIKKESKLTKEQKDAVDKFVGEVEKDTGKNIDGMTNDKRISELNKLKNKDGALTESEMKYRDALWATATDDPKWQTFRDGHINQISNAIVKDPSYIETKNKWGVMSSDDKLNYIKNITLTQQDIFGDDRTIKVKLFSEEPENLGGGIVQTTNGTYKAGSNTLSINKLSPNYNNFYSTIGTSTHEYGGHGYQDYILENKSSYLKQNPQFSNTVKLLEFSYSDKTAPKEGIKYEPKLGGGIYKLDPAERDAFHIGDSVRGKLKNQ